MGEAAQASGPDFSEGISPGDIPAEGTIGGRVGDEPVLLSRLGGELFAIGGACTHYGAHLADGIARGITVRCPLHHACFDLRTGAVLRAPALDAVDRWLVEVESDRVFVRRKVEKPRAASTAADIRRIVIVGGGAAGLACANELRRRGYEGELTILTADTDPPCDRPNLSKDYLAGTAPEEWLWLRGDDWYSDNRIDLRLGAEVSAVDPEQRTVRTSSGEEFAYDRLLIATGSEPNRLDLPGFDHPNVLTLRSVSDARAIAEKAQPGARVVIVGASFIALEVAAALRHRGVEVDIVSVEEVPLERVFGSEVGAHLQQLHESRGVRFHLSEVLAGFDGAAVALASGESIAADFVLVGIGVRPRTTVAELAGAEVDRGVLLDAGMRTSVPDIYAAGDIAAYPDPFTGEPIRVEHWVVAERQGEVAAANMLGEAESFDSAPFFWTEQYGVTIRYVGRAAAGTQSRSKACSMTVRSSPDISPTESIAQPRRSAATGRISKTRSRSKHGLASWRDEKCWPAAAQFSYDRQMLLVSAALLRFDYSAEVKQVVGFAIADEKCADGAVASDAIVVCGTRRTNHFRIEAAPRTSNGHYASRRAPRTSWFGWGRTGTGSCSAVGPGGYTGCLSQQVQSWRAGGGRVHF